MALGRNKDKLSIFHVKEVVLLHTILPAWTSAQSWRMQRLSFNMSSRERGGSLRIKTSQELRTGKILVYDFWTLWTLWISNSLNFELFEVRTLWSSNSLKFELYEVRTLWISNSLKFELFDFRTLWISNSLNFELLFHDIYFELLKCWTLHNISLYFHFHLLIGGVIWMSCQIWTEWIFSDNFNCNGVSTCVY